MGATGTSHRKPENIRKLDGDKELPAWITLDEQHLIVASGNGWAVFQRIPVWFKTRRAAAELLDNPSTKVIR
jgi:hypothetical protein